MRITLIIENGPDALVELVRLLTAASGNVKIEAPKAKRLEDTPPAVSISPENHRRALQSLRRPRGHR